MPFGRLVEQVMTTEPYSSASRVFWIVDNGSCHRGQRSVERLQGQWPTLRVIHLPVHASCLHQCEIYFSIVQRKVLNPNDLTSLEAIAGRLAAFEQRYNALARPFGWNLGRTTSTCSTPASTPGRPRHRPAALAVPSIVGGAHPRRRTSTSGPSS